MPSRPYTRIRRPGKHRDSGRPPDAENDFDPDRSRTGGSRLHGRDRCRLFTVESGLLTL